MSPAEIRDAARAVGDEATAEVCLHRTGDVAEIWVAGFIAGLEALLGESCGETGYRAATGLLCAARETAETVGTP